MSSTHEKNANSPKLIHHLSRLSDSIFALAMALTIIGFDLPDSVTSIDDIEVKKFVLTQLDHLSTYIITFILLAFYWIDHTQKFSHYKKSNEIHLWLYLFYLMFIFIVPYSNALNIYYPNEAIIKIWYSVNIFLIGLFSFLNWIYATTEHRLISTKLEVNHIKAISIKTLIEPVVSIITIAVAFWNQSLWDYTWLLVVVLYFVADKLLVKTVKEVETQ
ncbi:TMEM175 family protein [Gloeocapsa sp. BRSZ]